MDRRPRHAQNMLPWRADRIAAFVSDNGVWLRAVRINNDEPQAAIPITERGSRPVKYSLSASPLVVDGVLYVSGSDGLAQGFDLRAGMKKWEFVHKMDLGTDVSPFYGAAGPACCSNTSRGVAYTDGTIFLGTLYAKMMAIDAETGENKWELWSVKPQDNPDGIYGERSRRRAFADQADYFRRHPWDDNGVITVSVAHTRNGIAVTALVAVVVALVTTWIMLSSSTAYRVRLTFDHGVTPVRRIETIASTICFRHSRFSSPASATIRPLFAVNNFPGRA